MLPLVALLCSCSGPGAGGQKNDAETIKRIDDIAAKERGGGSAVGEAPLTSTPK
jgi:hypothetical protein